jgi:hypothetical protein
MESQGSPSPKPPPKTKRVKSQPPKDKVKRRDRLLNDENVQELLSEEREARGRGAKKLEEALTRAHVLKRCVRDGQGIVNHAMAQWNGTVVENKRLSNENHDWRPW